MKRFIDDQAIFEMEIPVNWNYSLVDGKVHTFSGYKPSNADCVQLQISKLKDDEEKKEFAELFGYLPHTEIGGLDYRSYPEKEHEGGLVMTKSWVTIWGEYLLLFSLTYLNSPEEQAKGPLNDETWKQFMRLLLPLDLLMTLIRKEF